MKKFRWLALLTIFLIMFPYFYLAGGLSARAFPQETGKKNKTYNVLLITIDTLRPDRLGCYNSPHLKTPAIDRLASEGIIFDRAFAHTPLTLPSHANILLGLTPIEHGVHDNGFFRVPENFPTLATWLKKSGYNCGAFIGAFPLDARFGLNRGFDVYDQGYSSDSGLDFKFAERKAEEVVDSALSWLKKQNQAWFLWIHCFDPHQPYEPPSPFSEQFKDDLYSGEVAYTDKSLSVLFDYLRARGLYEETIIILTGDHGQSLGEHGEATHGYFAYNSTIWVPLIIKAPGLKSGRISSYVCHADIFPTVCELLGQPAPEKLAGKSLVPLMKGKSLAPRKIYFESLYAYYRRGWAPLRGFIEGTKKFIDSPLPELYDLKQDFMETKNLATASISKEKEALNQLLKEAGSAINQPALKIDRQSQERLASLGYIGGYVPPEKKSFGPEDDLKTLLPFNQKFELAQELYYKGKVTESREILQEIISARPDFDNPYLFLTTILQKSGQLAEAEAVLKSGLKANPRNYKLWMEAGIVEVELGKYEEAINSLQQAMSLIDWDPDLWNYLGVAYWKKGQLEQALEVYEKALKIDPGYAVTLTNLGMTEISLAMRDREASYLARAAEHLAKALENDPHHAEAYNGLGVVRRLKGDLEGAINLWKKVIELNPGHRFALYNLGLAYLTRGDKAQARSYLEKYKALYYQGMSPEEREEIDAMIMKCQK